MLVYVGILDLMTSKASLPPYSSIVLRTPNIISLYFLFKVIFLLSYARSMWTCGVRLWPTVSLRSFNASSPFIQISLSADKNAFLRGIMSFETMGTVF